MGFNVVVFTLALGLAVGTTTTSVPSFEYVATDEELLVDTRQEADLVEVRARRARTDHLRDDHRKAREAQADPYSASWRQEPQPKFRAVWAGMTPGVWMRDGDDLGLCSNGAEFEMIEWQRQDPGSDTWTSLGVFDILACDQDPADIPGSAPQLTSSQIREAATSLIAAPEGFEVQPPNLVSYVNADNIVYLSPEPQIHHDVILGLDVWIQAQPVMFEWDFGDGTQPLITSHPNRPYPDHTYSHIYREPGEYVITLNTQWDAVYSLESAYGPWNAIDGHLITTNQSEPLTVRELRARLVNN